MSTRTASSSNGSTESRQSASGDRAPSEALSAAQRRRLKGLAHALEPIVRVGQSGLSPGVRSEIDRALDAHELIKVRFLGGKGELRASAQGMAESHGASLVGTVGHVAILYRRQEDPERRRVRV
jgi:RNA-binding protein